MSETAGFVWSRTFKEGLEEFKRATGGTVEPMMRDLFGLLVKKAYDWTPPENKGQGAATVERDVKKSIKATESNRLLNMLYNRFGPVTLVNQEMTGRDGAKWYVRNTTLDKTGSISALEGAHFARRNRQRAPVILTTKAAQTRYIAHVKKRVGKLKAGWQGPLEESGRKVAAWVAKAGREPGMHPALTATRTNYRVNEENWSGYVDAVNAADYGRDMPGRMRRAHAYIEKYTAGKHIQRWIEQAIERHRV